MMSNHMINMNNILNKADSVVMLTWSNWATELRSNRYHYATRFAKLCPVIFVQPDLANAEYRFEKTEIENLTILHLYQTYDSEQSKLLNAALLAAGCTQPIFWIYNIHFERFLINRYSILNIYHCTEDYLASDSRIKFTDRALITSYVNTLMQTQLIICVSEGVKESVQSSLEFYNGKIITITNGCDYDFYAPVNHFKPERKTDVANQKTIFYQGNIFNKLDYALLIELVAMMPDWTFCFCGKVLFNEVEWQMLCAQPNVNYLGLLTPEEVREQSYKATVGIIPFVQTEWLVVRSFPLKAFEYLASGLPVVSTPINSLSQYSDVIHFAKTATEFKAGIEKAERLRWDPKDTLHRLNIASRQNYDIKFQDAISTINEITQAQENNSSRLKVAVLYDSYSVKVNTINEHLASFKLYSNHYITYFAATRDLSCTVDLNVFDAIVIHYSIRVSVNDGPLALSKSYINEIKQFGGYKILFLQDEYEGTEIARLWIHRLGIHSVYTCVPIKYLDAVYPQTRFPKVQFINTLTGYVPILEKSNFFQKRKTTQRPILIGYRGRKLPYWYGGLGQEKLIIGVKVKEYCDEHNIAVDIEWDDAKRIYGESWYKFLISCRATLGTESGSNVFDYEGKIRAKIEKMMLDKPSLTFEDIQSEIASYETIKMNQVSPKIFEAILFKTALILFEGEYSNILTPDVHYIVLKKDFSNLDEVVSKVQDDAYVDQMTDKAYADIVLSKNFTYEKFIANFDQDVSNSVRTNALEKRLISFFNNQVKFKEDIQSAFEPHFNSNQRNQSVERVPKSCPTLKLPLNIESCTQSTFVKRVFDFTKKITPAPVKQTIKKLIIKL